MTDTSRAVMVYALGFATGFLVGGAFAYLLLALGSGEPFGGAP